MGKACGAYAVGVEHTQGAGTEMWQKRNTWKICFSVQIFINTFFINTADKCIVLLHSVYCVTVNVAVRLFRVLL